ncbi:MAG TPA: LIM domain-containing protein [Candidatus Eremiobacteraeota bacterium]|nr:MAG: hypothetical protein BWY64_02032 [bacterium ADurb.Bin363]HPZ06674.1 LIM domain-containing protein [Candidatus Eremiobacteraeota bacterium]
MIWRIFCSFLCIFILLSIFSFCFSKNLEVSDQVCTKCKQHITGEYWTIDGKVYCRSCMESLIPKCYKCGVLCTEGYYNIDGYNYCKNCFYKYARCDICGSLLEGTFKRTDKGGKFCAKCVAKYPACDMCSGPAGPKGYKISPSRYLCPACAAVAIFTHDQLAYIYKEAIAQLRSLGLVITRPVDNLSIMDENTLKSYYYNTKSMEYIPSGGVGGFYSFSLNHQGSASRIFVLNGLSYEKTLSVLSHELTHAWQIENCPLDQSLLLKEGFAQWISYKVMINKGFRKEAELLLKIDDPVYGEGLRYILNVEAYYGIQGTINYVKQVK